MNRQRIDEGAKAQPRRPLPDRGQEHTGRGRHAQRREVVLRDVIGVKAGTIERLDHLKPLFVILPQRQIIAVEMIENTEFQVHAGPFYANSARALVSTRQCNFAVRTFDHRSAYRNGQLSRNAPSDLRPVPPSMAVAADADAAAEGAPP